MFVDFTTDPRSIFLQPIQAYLSQKNPGSSYTSARARKYTISLVLDQGAKASNTLDNTNSPLGPQLLCQPVVSSWKSSQGLHHLTTEVAVEEGLGLVPVLVFLTESESRKTVRTVIQIYSSLYCHRSVGSTFRPRISHGHLFSSGLMPAVA